jgi:single-strand DNA-binding protein
MASFNKIIVVGHLGRDPELRYTSDGTAVCNFSVATTERRKDKTGEMQETTTWFRVNVWRRQAEIANQYLKKGKMVYVEGRLSQSEYQDREGQTRTTLEIQASDIQFIGSRGDEGGGGGSYEPRPAASRASQPIEPAGPISDDDIPF